MAAMLFDTLKLARELRSSFSPEQAEALAGAIAASAQESIATKADVAELKAAMKSDLADLKVKLVRSIVTAIAFDFGATAGFLVAALKVFRRSNGSARELL